MAIRLNVPGLGEVVCDTAADFLELKRAVEGERKPNGAAKQANAPAQPERAERPAPSSLSLTSPASRASAEEEALTMLRTIKAAMPRPATAEELVKALGVSHPKGLGSILGRVKDAIKKVGAEPEQVFSTQRTSLGRDYRPGPDFRQALELLEASQTL